MKHDTQYNDAISQAVTDWNTNDGREMKDKCPFLFSSNMADAYWITAFSLYHTGKVPRMLHKSRGMSWVVDMPMIGITKGVTVQKPDQRTGVIY